MFDAIVRYVNKDGFRPPGHACQPALAGRHIARARRAGEGEHGVDGQGYQSGDKDASSVDSVLSIDIVRAEMDAYLAQMALETERSIQRWTAVKQIALYCTLCVAILFYLAMSAIGSLLR